MTDEIQYDMLHTDVARQSSPQHFMPVSALVKRTVSAIQDQMREGVVIVAGISYGKDSATLLACTLEAACRHLAETGISPVVRVSTIDTLVDNPLAMSNARKMSARMSAWKAKQNLDVEQVWATPNLLDRFLVKLIGGRDIAPTANGNSSCAVDMKIRPVQALKASLRKQFPGKKIVTLIGTRYAESAARGNAMREREERFDVPVLNEAGDWIMSPLADWALGHVWGFINDVVGGEAPFDVFDDFIGLTAVYESSGESSCSADAFSGVKQAAGMGCGSSGRMGCWSCQKVSNDHSLLQILETFPEYAPLVRLSSIIRAGQDVPANRSFLGRKLASDGTISIGGNAYAPKWCETLLKLVLTVDQNEIEWAEAESERRGRPVQPRFRVMTDEELVAVSFMWGRYGMAPASRVFVINESIRFGGNRYELSDTEIADLKRRRDPAACRRQYGRLQLFTQSEMDQMSPTDGRLDVAAQSAGVADTLMVDGRGAAHSAIRVEPGCLDVELGPEPELSMWFLTHKAVEVESVKATERPYDDFMSFMIRQNVISFPNGYLGRLRDATAHAARIEALGLGNIANDPTALTSRHEFNDGRISVTQVDLFG